MLTISPFWNCIENSQDENIMNILRSNFVPVSVLEDVPLSYQWDDWNPYLVIGEASAESEKRLRELSDRAVLAYAISCSEWVIYRLNKHFSDQRPFQFIEACWAFEMSDRYAAPPESIESEWKGQVLGPIDLSLMTILNCIYSFGEDSSFIDCAFSELIAIHVLSLHAEPFYQWREKVLGELVKRFPREGRGDNIYVPRELMNPERRIDEGEEAGLVNSFLKRVDVKENPFLRRLREL